MLSFAFGTTLVAKTAQAAPAWSAATTITAIDAEDTSDVPPGGNGVPRQFIYFKAVPFSTPCSLASTSAWRIGGSPDNIKYILSVANAAKLAGRSVLVMWNSGAQNQCDGSTTGGALGYPVVIGLQIQ